MAFLVVLAGLVPEPKAHGRQLVSLHHQPLSHGVSTVSEPVPTLGLVCEAEDVLCI